MRPDRNFAWVFIEECAYEISSNGRHTLLLHVVAMMRKRNSRSQAERTAREWLQTVSGREMSIAKELASLSCRR